jgi:hypothetical protein
MDHGGGSTPGTQRDEFAVDASIAFVCDASGSMMEKMEALKKELSKTVEALHPFQKFSITFFQNDKPTVIDKDLILAKPENKRKAEAFIADVSTNGSIDPIPGLDIAFHQRPQLVYLLTDGDFPNNDAVVQEIHKLDPDRRVKVNTIAFTDSSDHDMDYIKLLQQLAKDSGGTFRHVNEEALK